MSKIPNEEIAELIYALSDVEEHIGLNVPFEVWKSCLSCEMELNWLKQTIYDSISTADVFKLLSLVELQKKLLYVIAAQTEELQRKEVIYASS